MKTKSRNLLISVLLMIAMLFGVFAITPLTAFAIAAPDPTKINADKIYVGGVELGLGQYVKNGETTPIDGAPAEDATGFAFYTEGGTLVLVDYTYTGKGYEYSSGNFALVYSTGTLYVAGGGVNTLKQTQNSNMGIYSVGALTLSPSGTLTIEGDNCSCLYSNNEIIFESDLGTVNLKSTGNATAIVSYDNDGDTADEQAIIVNGGDIYVETFFPISDLTINYGAFKVSSPQYALSQLPDISNYGGGYTITVSENEDGSNPETYNQDTIGTFNTDNLDNYKYFRIAPPEKTVINSVSVSGIDLPQIGEAFVYPDETALTYGGEYMAVGCWMERYTGTEWEDYSESTDVVEHSVKYRYVLTLRPNAGYTFSEEMTDNNVTINGKDGVVLMVFPDDAFTNKVEVALEFSYEAPATGYGIFIADKDESGATVGVEINEENRTDVLGDGTVSYDPTTSTLTLNGYKYEGEGFLSGSDYYYGICVTEFFDDLTLVLAGENVITMTDSGTGMMHEPYYTGIELWNGNMTIKGDGSLAISSPGDGICVYGGEDGRGVLEIKGGSITIEGDDEGIYTDNSFKMTGGSLTVGATYGIYTYVFEMNGGSITVNAVADYAPGAICAYESFLMNGGTITASATGENAYTIYLEGDFTMNGGSLKLSADCDGIILWEDSSIVVSGGTLEISTKEAGHAFIRNTESDGAVSIVPTVTGDYSMTASVNEDGSSAVIYDEDAHETYKYVKIAFVTKYGITIADKDESGATVGVEITSENYTDVLGDGTVSYDPTTNTLTLNGYKYEGEGVYFEEQGAFFCLMADVPTEGLTIVLVGDNMISVSGNGSAGMMFFEGEGDDLTIKGNGSLAINAVMYGIALQADNGRLTIEGGVIDIIITGTMSVGIQAADFVMMDADLKITTAMLGIAAYSEDGICINGGSLEIDTTMGGYAFVCVDFEHMAFIPIMADLSGYVGAYKMTAGIKQDGSDATDFDEEYLSSYKYVKVEPTHVHDHGTAWESDANEHWNECECGDKANKAAHTDSDTNGKCDVCGADVPVAPPSHTHDYGTTWKTDENNHWNECECGDKANTAPHADENNDGKCDTCDYAMGNADNPGGDKESEKAGLSGGAIAGIAVGSVAVAGLGGFSLFWFVIKKKKFADLIALFKKK